MIIRPLKKNDELEDVVRIFNSASAATDGLPDTDATFENFRELTEGEVVLVAWVNGEIAGFVSVFEPERFIHHLYVSPKHQGSGVGRLLLEECESRYGRPLSLKCVEANAKACAFYDHLGWTRNGSDIGPDGPYFHYVLFDT